MTIPFVKLKARLLADPRVRAEYDALAPEFEIAAELLRARLRAGLSQAELAARMGTGQSTIARLESGQTLTLGAAHMAADMISGYIQGLARAKPHRARARRLPRWS
jgi:DNA-binding transcriptional regulator YiaG